MTNQFTVLEKLLNGRIPLGYPNNLFGKFLSGKTLLTLQIGVRYAKQTKGNILLIDVDGGADLFLQAWLPVFQQLYDWKGEVFIEPAWNTRYTAPNQKYVHFEMKTFHLFGVLAKAEISEGGKTEFVPKGICLDKVEQYITQKNVKIVIVDSFSQIFKDCFAGMSSFGARARAEDMLYSLLKSSGLQHKDVMFWLNHHESLPYYEKVVVLTPRNEIKIVPIGELVAQRPEGYKAVSFDPKTLQVGFYPISDFIEHQNIRRTINRIFFGSYLNKNPVTSVDLTDDHGVFRYYYNKVKCLPTTALNADDQIVTIHALPELQVFNEIVDILPYCETSGIAIETDGRSVLTKYSNTKQPLKRFIRIDEDFGWLAGAIISEGAIMPHGVSISNSNIDFLNKCSKTFENTFGVKPGVDLIDRETAIGSVLLSKVLVNQFGFTPSAGLNKAARHYKIIPSVILSSSKNVLRSFLKAYTLGDGGQNVDGTYSIYTFSKNIVDCFRTILQRLGIRFWVVQRKKQTGNWTKGIWIEPSKEGVEYEIVYKESASYHNLIIGKYLNEYLRTLRVHHIEKLPYEGNVYDLSVPGPQNFLTASGIFVHNSVSPIKKTIDMAGGGAVILNSKISVYIEKMYGAASNYGRLYIFRYPNIPEWGRVEYTQYTDMGFIDSTKEEVEAVLKAAKSK